MASFLICTLPGDADRSAGTLGFEPRLTALEAVVLSAETISLSRGSDTAVARVAPNLLVVLVRLAGDLYVFNCTYKEGRSRYQRTRRHPLGDQRKVEESNP